MSRLELTSPAKINLFLTITGKRSDGYHLLFTLMSPIAIFDKLSIEPDASEFSITCDHPQVPSDESNLALRAARAFFAAHHTGAAPLSGAVAIHLEKQIPVGAGLGGGSSNAATVLLGLNRYFGRPFELSALMEMGLELGADVPFFLYEYPAIARGIGEKLEAYKEIYPYKVLVVYPGFEVSTAMIYKNINLRLTNCKKKINYSSFKNKKFDPDLHLCNDLECAAIALHSELSEIKELLIHLGACGALMSGSGSSVFGLFNDIAIVEKAYKDLCQKKKWQVFLTDMIL